jgi:hypothetical protein
VLRGIYNLGHLTIHIDIQKDSNVYIIYRLWAQMQECQVNVVGQYPRLRHNEVLRARRNEKEKPATNL